mgnify:CR=1 FL=1
MKNLLILYPHGLGDCILLTPVLRNYFFNTGRKAAVAVLERFKTAKMFDNNPYVSDIIYTKDAWNDFENAEVGFQTVFNTCNEWCEENGYHMVMPKHDNWNFSKILINFKYCDVEPTSVFTEVFTTDKDKEEAMDFIKQKFHDEPFGFVQTITGRPLANLPEGYGRTWLKMYKNIDNVIEAGVDYDILQFNINTQIEIMRQATAVCLPDSVFFNACGAIGKPIDHVYIAPTWGPRGYKRVRPLHDVKQNVVFTLDQEVLKQL